MEYLIAMVLLTKIQYFRSYFPQLQKRTSICLNPLQCSSKVTAPGSLSLCGMHLTFCFPGNVALQSQRNHFFLLYSHFTSGNLGGVCNRASPPALDPSQIEICFVLGSFMSLELLKYFSPERSARILNPCGRGSQLLFTARRVGFYIREINQVRVEVQDVQMQMC